MEGRCPFMGSSKCIREECCFYDSIQGQCCIQTIVEALAKIAVNLESIREMKKESTDG